MLARHGKNTASRSARAQQTSKSEQIMWILSEKQVFEHSHSRGVDKCENSVPTEHRNQTKTWFPRSMGITFLVFATPLARERPKCNAQSTRPRAKCMFMRSQKSQYFIRGVAKMENVKKTSRHQKNLADANVQKTVGGSKIFDRARKNSKGHNLHVTKNLGIL